MCVDTDPVPPLTSSVLNLDAYPIVYIHPKNSHCPLGWLKANTH